MPTSFEVRTGTYVGGTDSSVTLGFKPSLLVTVNETDGDVVNVKIGGSSDATHISIGSAAAAVSSNGYTLSSTGFTIGSDTSIAESGKTFRYWAVYGG